jgi:hypothetical protein
MPYWGLALFDCGHTFPANLDGKLTDPRHPPRKAIGLCPDCECRTVEREKSDRGEDAWNDAKHLN